MNDVILDASALMAVLREEPGGEVVERILPQAIIGAVNLSEVYAKLTEAGMPEQVAWSAVADLGLKIIAFDEPLAQIAGSLRSATRKAGLSFGDRACLALAKQLGLPVYTADRAWRALGIGVDVEIVR